MQFFCRYFQLIPMSCIFLRGSQQPTLRQNISENNFKLSLGYGQAPLPTAFSESKFCCVDLIVRSRLKPYFIFNFYSTFIVSKQLETRTMSFDFHSLCPTRKLILANSLQFFNKRRKKRVAFGIGLSSERYQGNMKDYFLENAPTRYVIVKPRFNSNIPLLSFRNYDCLFLPFPCIETPQVFHRNIGGNP